jgi:hypothetical protein
MATVPPSVSVTSPVEPALAWTKRVLFRPFDLGKWLTIAFCAWLAYLAQGGLNGGSALRSRLPTPGHLPLPGSFPSPPKAGETPDFGRLQDWAMANLSWLLPVGIALVCFLIAFGIFLLWLSCRGEFMFLHCVALDRGEVAAPWRRYAREAKSLFLFRLAFGLIVGVPLLLLLVFFAFFIYRLTQRTSPMQAAGFLPVIFAGFLLFLIVIGAAVVAKLTRDFAVPIMYLRGGTCRAAWGEILALFSGRPGLPILYLLFQIVLGLVIAVLLIIAIFATCCIAACFLAIPYVGTVLLLPIYIFLRSYSLFYLRQLGPQYDVFPRPPIPAAPPIPPPAPLAPSAPA